MNDCAAIPDDFWIACASRARSGPLPARGAAGSGLQSFRKSGSGDARLADARALTACRLWLKAGFLARKGICLRLESNSVAFVRGAEMLFC